MPNKQFERQICERHGVSYWIWTSCSGEPGPGYCGWDSPMGRGGASSVPSLMAVRLVVESVSAEIAKNTAEEMAEANFVTLVALIAVFLPPVRPTPLSFPGFLSCQCLAFLATENLAYTALG